MTFDETLAKERGLTWERDGDLLKVQIPGHAGIVQVFERGGALSLVPERSHHHRALIQALS